MSVVTAHMVYFCVFACSEIFQKNARKSGVGRGQFDAGVNGLKVPSTSTQCSLKGDEEAVLMATRKETEWLDHTTKHLEENKVTDYKNVTTLQTKTRESR